MLITRLNIKKCFLGVITLLTFTTLQATTYYVDATGGSDSDSGTSTGSAWQTIAKVNTMSSKYLPGDNIAFRRGKIWSGERIRSINHPSGTSTQPISYTAYGAGARPIININIDQNPTWKSEGNNKWSAIISTGARFFKNGIEMFKAPSYDYLGLYSTEYYTVLVNGGNNLQLFVYGNPVGNSYRWDNYSAAVELKGANYININNLDIRGGSSGTVIITNNQGWKISDSNIGKNAGYGITIKGSSNILIDNVVLDANSTVDQSTLPVGNSGIDDTGSNDGIFIGKGSDAVTIRNSYFKNWGHASFGSNSDDPAQKITNTKFYNNELTSPDIIYGGRIAYSGYAEDGEYYNNYIHDISVANQLGGSRNHFHHNIIDGVTNSPLKKDKIGIGIWLQNYNIQVKDNIIENNIIANTESHGFEIFSINWDKPGEVSGNIFRNNILYNCGITDDNIAIQYHEDQYGEMIYNNKIENNLIYNTQTELTFLNQYNGTIHNVTGFNAINTDISNNIAGNPLFNAIGAADYHLQNSSPAINSGTTALATSDYEGNFIPTTGVDIGIYESQNSLEELLNNPSFESDGANWALSGSAAITSSNVHRGSRAIKFACDGSWGMTQQTIDASENFEYMIRGWIKTVNIDKTAVLKVQFLDSSWHVINSTDVADISGSTSYKKYALNIVAPTGTTHVRLRLLDQGNHTGKIYFDDLSITQLPPAIALLRFDETFGSTAADTSNNTNDGIVHGALWQVGHINNALDFDGVNDYVSLTANSSLDLTDKVSISAWVNAASVSTYMEIVNKYWNRFTIGANLGGSGAFSISYRNENNSLYSHYGTTAITTGEWYHLMAEIEAGERVKLYVNGVKEVDEAFVGAAIKSASNRNITIGAGGSNGEAYHFKGKIDDVRIYNTVLSSGSLPEN